MRHVRRERRTIEQMAQIDDDSCTPDHRQAGVSRNLSGRNRLHDPAKTTSDISWPCHRLSGPALQSVPKSERTARHRSSSESCTAPLRRTPEKLLNRFIAFITPPGIREDITV